MIWLLLAACRPPAAPRAPITVHPGEGIAPLRLDEGCDDARARMGEPEGVVSDPGEVEVYYEWFSRGLSVSCTRSEVILAIFAHSGRVGDAEPGNWTPYPAPRPSGLSFDSTYDQALAALGTPVGQGDLTAGRLPVRWLGYPGLYLDFVAQTGTMISASVFRP